MGQAWAQMNDKIRRTKTRHISGGPVEAARSAQTASGPGWTHGLRQLYDSVVDEPLPDSFKDLLAKLDGDA